MTQPFFRVKVRSPFTDAITGEFHHAGEIVEVNSIERLKKIINRKLGMLEFAKARTTKKKSGNEIIIYQKLLYCIGGIETWDYNLAKIFEGRNLKFVFSYMDLDQALRISEYCDVELDHPTKYYKCDVFISANYDGGAIMLDRVSARKKYQTIHSDFKSMKEKVVGWKSFKLKLDPRFDAVLSASDTARKGLKDGFGIDSTVVQNPLAKMDDKPLVLITLSRASAEKGIDKVIKMAKELDRRNLNFIWLLATTLKTAPQYEKQIRAIKQFVVVPPTIYAQRLLHTADYLCQFSLTEAYCYSIHEALQAGIPVIATEFAESKKVIKDGKNGYLLKQDFSNFDDKFINKIFNQIPNNFTYKEPIDKNWSKVMDGEL